MIYHGVRRTPSSSIYRLGLALFDLEQPEKMSDSRGFLDVCARSGIRNVMEMFKTLCFLAAIRWRPMGTRSISTTVPLIRALALAHGSIRGLLAWLDANGHSEHVHDRRQRHG